MYEEGQAPSQIAVQVGLSALTIRRVLKDQGIAFRGRGDAQQIDLFGAESPEAAPLSTGMAGAGQPGGEESPETLPRVGVEDGQAKVGDQAADAVELGATVAAVDALRRSEVGVGSRCSSSLVEPRCEGSGGLDEAVEQPAPGIVWEGCLDWQEEASSGHDEGSDLSLAVARDVALSVPSAEREGAWNPGLTKAAEKVEATSIPYAPPWDRLTTVLGMIEEVPVRFQTARGVCGAGVLLGLALLDSTHLLVPGELVQVHDRAIRVRCLGGLRRGAGRPGTSGAESPTA